MGFPLTVVERIDSRRGGRLTRLGNWKIVCAICLLCASAAIASPARTFTTVADFDSASGGYPLYMSLIQGFDGNFYGTDFGAGVNGQGAVFRIDSVGTLTTLYSFCSLPNCADGQDPEGGLIQASDGNFYGTTAGGGQNSQGTVFKITPGGDLTTLYSFCGKSKCADGIEPSAGLIQATDGNFYGTTQFGGLATACGSGCGTVFEITPEGSLTALYRFCTQANCADGVYPIAGPVQATNGNFYGTTSQGGVSFNCSAGCGTVFEIAPGGNLTTLHSFVGTDGNLPFAGLIQSADGNFYGTASAGGANNYGTVFEISPAGALTTLHDFDGADGGGPYAALIQATNKSFYGTTYQGGTNSYGTVFKITSAGELTTLHSFDFTDGSYPSGGLLQSTSGEFYGTTSQGGGDGVGTIFSLAVGLRPFVKTVPTAGQVGSAIVILGTNLTDATGVSFKGKAAAFTVVSSSEIATTVPSGAKTGSVTVTTPASTLKSNVPFQVEP